MGANPPESSRLGSAPCRRRISTALRGDNAGSPPLPQHHPSLGHAAKRQPELQSPRRRREARAAATPDPSPCNLRPPTRPDPTPSHPDALLLLAPAPQRRAQPPRRPAPPRAIHAALRTRLPASNSPRAAADWRARRPIGGGQMPPRPSAGCEGARRGVATNAELQRPLPAPLPPGASSAPHQRHPAPRSSIAGNALRSAVHRTARCFPLPCIVTTQCLPVTPPSQPLTTPSSSPSAALCPRISPAIPTASFKSSWASSPPSHLQYRNHHTTTTARQENISFFPHFHGRAPKPNGVVAVGWPFPRSDGGLHFGGLVPLQQAVCCMALEGSLQGMRQQLGHAVV